MAHFYGVFHGYFTLRYVGGVLVLRKLDLGVSNVNTMSKKANFRGLIAKIGNYRPIFMEYAMGITT